MIFLQLVDDIVTYSNTNVFSGEYEKSVKMNKEIENQDNDHKELNDEHEQLSNCCQKSYARKGLIN